MSENEPEQVDAATDGVAAPGDEPTDENAVDEAGKQSFPTSDPPSGWAGSDEKPD